MLEEYDPYISPAVLNEITKGDSQAIQERLDAVVEFSVLSDRSEIMQIARMYFESTGIPEKARTDTIHLAFATYYRIQYLVTWNCKHIANVHVQEVVRQINTQHHLATPYIYTSMEMMPLSEE